MGATQFRSKFPTIHYSDRPLLDLNGRPHGNPRRAVLRNKDPDYVLFNESTAFDNSAFWETVRQHKEDHVYEHKPLWMSRPSKIENANNRRVACGAIEGVDFDSALTYQRGSIYELTRNASRDQWW